MFAMRHPGVFFFLLFAALAFLRPTLAVAQQVTPTPSTMQEGVRFISPLPGQALQGSVLIAGNTVVDGFQSAELSFSYANDSTDTWFLIQEYSAPVSDNALALWDTSTISDGNYRLRLAVTKSDGSQESALVPGLRVRNYTPIETDTPAPVPPAATPLPQETRPASATPIPTQTPTRILSTPTPLPPNPAVLSTQQVFASIFKGILATLGLFALGGLYQAARSLRRRG